MTYVWSCIETKQISNAPVVACVMSVASWSVWSSSCRALCSKTWCRTGSLSSKGRRNSGFFLRTFQLVGRTGRLSSKGRRNSGFFLRTFQLAQVGPYPGTGRSTDFGVVVPITQLIMCCVIAIHTTFQLYVFNWLYDNTRPNRRQRGWGVGLLYMCVYIVYVVLLNDAFDW